MNFMYVPQSRHSDFAIIAPQRGDQPVELTGIGQWTGS